MKKVFKNILMFFVYWLLLIAGGLLTILVGAGVVLGSPAMAVYYLIHPEKLENIKTLK